MLKQVGGCKSTARPKSTRMPLRNISNSKNGARDFSRSTKTKLKPPGKKEQEDAAVSDNSLDRLLLVHSELSSIVGQIDELVVQALQSKKEIKEINSFADFLSEMQSSLKQWVPRFQKSLSDPSGSENKPEQPPTSNKVADSPEQYKWDSLVCSSPLVSWRGDCTSECERQLFLLTPLHQQPKGFLSKLKESSKSGFEEIRTEQIAQMPSAFDEMLGVGNNNILGSAKTEKSYILMTPCLKVSPPRSCVVLEPVSEHHKGSLKLRKSTPYPVALEFANESQDSESSDDLNVKYPELFGIKLGNKFENRWKVAEESPKWSPPKTCVLLEPHEDAAPRDCSVPLTALNPNQKNLLPRRNNTRELGRECEFVESCTPMAKEPESCIKTGKQHHHPGENTLKRELWTKFEAASTRAVCFDPRPAMQKMNLHKGFLDRLDEASSDE